MRARQLSGADIGTLTALGQSVSTFWGGSCNSVGGSGATAATAMSASMAADHVVAPAAGARTQFGVRGALASTADADGGQSQPVAFLETDVTSNRNALVAILFVISGFLGAAIGALSPRRQRA